MNNNKEIKTEKLIRGSILFLFFLIISLIVTIITLFAMNTQVGHKALFVSLVLVAGISVAISLVMYYLWREKIYVSTNDTVLSASEIASMSEKLQKRGIINYDINGKIIFMSRWLFSTELSKFLGKKVEKLGIEINDDDEQMISLDGLKFRTVLYNRTRTLIIFDVTNEQNLMDFISDNKTAIMLVKRTLSSSLDEVSSFKASLEISYIIEKWAKTNNAIFKTGQTIDQPILIIGTWNDIKKAIYSDSLLNEVNIKNIKNISLSIGVAYGSMNYNEILESAIKANVISINRGGNQIVILNEKGEYEYVGSSLRGIQTDSKIKIKQYTDLFFEEIKKYKNIFITSHVYADLDALASTIAIAKAITKKGESVKIILETFDDTTSSVYKTLSPEIKNIFITQEEALKKTTKKTALVITDVSEKDRIQASKVLENISENSVYIIDHHRVGENIIKISEEKRYIDTTASSVSEIITEMIYLVGIDSIITDELATLLISGIYLDTNQLARNSTSRTHEVISELIKKGGDIKAAANKLLASLDEIPILTKALNNAKIIGNNILFSVIPESNIISDSEVSLLANSLLNYKNVRAAVVVAKIKGNLYKVSIRSTDKVNSQLLAEAMGGGGHFNTAAISFKRNETTYKKVIAEVKKSILNINKK